MKKYVHLLWHNETKFNIAIVKLLSDASLGLESEHHHFITPHKAVYEQIKQYPNVQLVDFPVGSAKFVNKCAQEYEWIFLHSIESRVQALFYSRRARRKIIWRTWGQDALYVIYNKSVLNDTVKRVLNFLYKRVVRDFMLVGIANPVDETMIKGQFGDVPTARMPYAKDSSDKLYNELLAIKTRCEQESKTGRPLRVMIGHSGWSADKHVQMAKKLEKYIDENIELVVPLSYGDSKYIESIKPYFEQNWGQKAVLVESFMPYSEYAELLASIDVIILPLSVSYALGNVSLGLLFGKKLYLNGNGIIHKALSVYGVPHECIDSIDGASFDEFSKPLSFEEGVGKEFMPQPGSRNIEFWHDILNKLNSKK